MSTKVDSESHPRPNASQKLTIPSSSISSDSSTATKTESDRRHEIRAASAEMKGLIDGRKTLIGDIRTDKTNEEQLFATMILRRMKNRHPAVVPLITSDLSKEIDTARRAGAPRPIATAMVSILEKAESASILSRQDLERAVGFALGKAQLDSPDEVSGLGSLSTVAPESIVDSRGHLRANSLESVITRVRSNQRLSPDIARIFIGAAHLTQLQGPPASSAPPSDSGAIRDTQFSTVWHHNDKTYSGAHCFHYRPASDLQGSVAELLIPRDLSVQYPHACLFDESTGAIYELKRAETGPDGRAKWLIEGNSAKSQAGTFVLTDRSGASIHFSVGNLSKEALREQG